MQDLTKMSTTELKDLYAECLNKITQMVADLETVVLCSEIERELQKRK